MSSATHPSSLQFLDILEGIRENFIERPVVRISNQGIALYSTDDFEHIILHLEVSCDVSCKDGSFVWPPWLTREFLTWAFSPSPPPPVETYLNTGGKTYLYTPTSKGTILKEKDAPIFLLRGKEGGDFGRREGNLRGPIDASPISLKWIVDEDTLTLGLHALGDSSPAVYTTKAEKAPDDYNPTFYDPEFPAEIQLKNLDRTHFHSLLDSIETDEFYLTFGAIEGGGHGLIVSYRQAVSKGPSYTVFCCFRFVQEEGGYSYQDTGHFLLKSTIVATAPFSKKYFSNALATCASLPTFNLDLWCRPTPHIRIHVSWSSGEYSLFIVPNRAELDPPNYTPVGFAPDFSTVTRLKNLDHAHFRSLLDLIEADTFYLTFGVVEGGGHGLVVSYPTGSGGTVFCCLRFVQKEGGYSYQDTGHFLLKSTILPPTAFSKNFFSDALTTREPILTFDLDLWYSPRPLIRIVMSHWGSYQHFVALSS
jgi:hypothetical protein